MTPWIETDVLVIGAGAAGWPAAIGAARAGAKVVLLDDDPYPGGAAVDQFVSMPDGGPLSGVVTEYLAQLERRFALTNRPVDKWWYFWYLPSDILRVVNELLAAEPNLTLVCPAKASRLTLDGTRVTGAWCRMRPGRNAGSRRRSSSRRPARGVSGSGRLRGPVWRGQPRRFRRGHCAAAAHAARAAVHVDVCEPAFAWRRCPLGSARARIRPLRAPQSYRPRRPGTPGWRLPSLGLPCGLPRHARPDRSRRLPARRAPADGAGVG